MKKHRARKAKRKTKKKRRVKFDSYIFTFMISGHRRFELFDYVNRKTAEEKAAEILAKEDPDGIIVRDFRLYRLVQQ